MVPNPDLDFQLHRMRRLQLKPCIEPLFNKLRLLDFKVNTRLRKASIQAQEECRDRAGQPSLIISMELTWDKWHHLEFDRSIVL